MLKRLTELPDENKFIMRFNVSSESQKQDMLRDENNAIALEKLSDENFKAIWLFIIKIYEQHNLLPMSKQIAPKVVGYTLDYILAHPAEEWKKEYYGIFDHVMRKEFLEQNPLIWQKFIKIIPRILKITQEQIKIDMLKLFILRSFLFDSEDTTVREIGEMLRYCITSKVRVTLHHNRTTSLFARLYEQMNPFDRYSRVFDCLFENQSGINTDAATILCKDAHQNIKFLNNPTSIVNFIDLAIKAEYLGIPFHLMPDDKKIIARANARNNLNVLWVSSPESELEAVLSSLANDPYEQLRLKLNRLFLIESRQNLDIFPDKKEARVVRISAILNFLLEQYALKVLNYATISSDQYIIEDEVFRNCLRPLRAHPSTSYDANVALDHLLNLFKYCEQNSNGLLILARQCFQLCQQDEISAKKYLKLIACLDRNTMVNQMSLPLFLASQMSNKIFADIENRDFISGLLYTAALNHGAAVAYFFKHFNSLHPRSGIYQSAEDVSKRNAVLFDDCYDELYLYLYNGKVKVIFGQDLKFEAIEYTVESNFSEKILKENLFFNAILLFDLLDRFDVEKVKIKLGEIINLLNEGPIGDSCMQLELSYDNFIKLDDALNSINHVTINEFSKDRFLNRLFTYGFIKEIDLASLDRLKSVDLRKRIKPISQELYVRLLEVMNNGREEYIAALEKKLITQMPKSNPAIFWQELISLVPRNTAQQPDADCQVEKTFT